MASSALVTWVLSLVVTASVYGQTGVVVGNVEAMGVSSPENVIIYISKVSGDYPPAESSVLMHTEKLEFIPAVLPVVVGTTVRFDNHDRVRHNVMWHEGIDGAYPSKDLGTWEKGGVREFTFGREGIVTVGCKIHPEMAAHIVVLQNPFSATVGKDGTYAIEGVPAGSYSLKTWYANRRKLKPQTKEIEVASGETTVQDFSLSRR
jgi:plastocyanin